MTDIVSVPREKRVDAKGRTEKEFLANYKPGNYEKPSVTVDMLVFTIIKNKLNLLLIKRKGHPFLGDWAIPGGFVAMNESSEDAAKRELKEETNLENIYMEQLYTYSQPNRDPRMRVISTSYLALVSEDKLNPIAGDDASEVAWFSVEKTFKHVDKDKNRHSWLLLENKELGIKIETEVLDIPFKNGVITNYKPKVIYQSKDQLAFDHIEIVNMAIDRLRNKVEYTPLPFNLAKKEFTLPELQKIYEILLGKPLYKTTFRKQVEDMIVPLEKKRNTSRRPAELYKYKDD